MFVISPHLSAHGEEGTVLIARPSPASTANEVERERKRMTIKQMGIEHWEENLLCRET